MFEQEQCSSDRGPNTMMVSNTGDVLGASIFGKYELQ